MTVFSLQCNGNRLLPCEPRFHNCVGRLLDVRKAIGCVTAPRHQNRKRHCLPRSLSPANGGTTGITEETSHCERKRTSLSAKSDRSQGKIRLNGSGFLGQIWISESFFCFGQKLPGWSDLVQHWQINVHVCSETVASGHSFSVSLAASISFNVDVIKTGHQAESLRAYISVTLWPQQHLLCVPVLPIHRFTTEPPFCLLHS